VTCQLRNPPLIGGYTVQSNLFKRDLLEWYFGLSGTLLFAFLALCLYKARY
jgi:hypothetical protein